MATRRAKSPSCTGQFPTGWIEQIDLASSLDSAKLKNLSRPMVPAGTPPFGQVRPDGVALDPELTTTHCFHVLGVGFVLFFGPVVRSPSQ